MQNWFRCWLMQFIPLICREACETALKEKHFLDDSHLGSFSVEAIISHMKQLEVLSRVFKEAGEADIPGEVRTCFLFIAYNLFQFSFYSCGVIIR